MVTSTTVGKTTQATTIKNPIDRIPVTPHYNKKSLTRGLSTSDLHDIAGVQIGIYNDLSELSQMIRGANHKTLVKNLNDQASTGAGGIIFMDPDTPLPASYLICSRPMQAH